MTAQIIQLRDYQNPKDLARMYGETTLEQQAIGFAGQVQYIDPSQANAFHVPYGGTGIDGMSFLAPE